MNVKRLLKFYFSAGNLNAAMDRAIERLAARSADIYAGCEYYAEKISLIITEKSDLSDLWRYIDSALSEIGDGKKALKLYAEARHGIGAFPEETAKAVRRAAVRFSRCISRGIGAYRSGVELVNKWYCIMKLDDG